MNSEAVFSAAFFSSELAPLPLMTIQRKGVRVFYPEKKLSQVPFAKVEGPSLADKGCYCLISSMPVVVAEREQLPCYL